MRSDRESIWSVEEQPRMRRVLVALVLLWLVTAALYVVWRQAPTPMGGWWLAAGIVAMITGTIGLALTVWQAIQIKKRTGSYWPQARR